MGPDGIYREWLKKGNDDIVSAKILLGEDGPPDTICFHCQQAAEKHLKAFLTYKGIEFPKIHDLFVLTKECVKIDSGFKGFIDDAKTLNAYYIESRYPPDVDYVSKEEAERSIEMADKIVSYVLNRLKEK